MATIEPIRILGGGLAGLALGIGLRQRQIPVSLIEAGHYPRHRVCGEVMSVSGQEILRNLELMDRLPETILHRTVSWWLKGKKILSTELPKPSLGLSRFCLDQTMASYFIQLNGKLNCGQRAEPSNTSGEVIATGRSRVKSHWYGLKVHLKNFSLTSDLEMHLGRGGYVGISKVEEGWVNFCGLFQRHNKSTLSTEEDLIISHLRSAELFELAEKVQSASKRLGSQTAVAGFQCGTQSQTSYLVLGDSDRMIPPFTGHGMSMALESAWSALDPIELFARGKMSWLECCNQVKHRLNQSFHQPMQVSSLLHPLLTQPLGQKILQGLCATRLLPFSTLFHLVH